MDEISNNRRILREVTHILQETSRKLNRLRQKQENEAAMNTKQGVQNGDQNSRYLR